jgi:DNA-binding transcriptional regulator YdaS (Cro superfamily)
MATSSLKSIFPDRVLRRPAALEATRICGFTDSEVARLMGIVPMVVSMWVSGKRPIPKVRHQALVLFVYSLTNVAFGEVAFASPTAHALRTRLLRQAITPLLELAIAECGEPTEETDEQIEALIEAHPEVGPGGLDEIPLAWYTEEAATLANQMLERLKAMVVK